MFQQVDQNKLLMYLIFLPTELIETLGHSRSNAMPIGINVNKAKELHKDKIHEVRNPLLQAEDITFMRAVEAADSTAQAASATRKQALRDATNIVDSASITATDVNGVTTELKAVWDADVLGDNPL
jgi:hypothetical protein